MSSTRSIALHRGAVTAIVLTAFVVVLRQAHALWRLESSIPLSDLEAYSPLFFSVYGGVLALFMAWKVPGREDGRLAALMLAFLTSVLALTVVPSGSSSFAQRAAASISISGGYLLAMRFMLVFPRAISLADLDTLRNTGPKRTVGMRVGQMFRGAQAFTISHPSVTWCLGILFTVLFYLHTSLAAYPYHLFYMTFGPMAWVTLLLLAPVELALVILITSFLWTGYRLANAEVRRKILWILLGVLFFAVWAAVFVPLLYLVRYTDSRVILEVFLFIVPISLPVLFFVCLTGFAVAVLYSGDFDEGA